MVYMSGGIMTLKEFFKTNPKIALGFSGGVDSSYLLYAAKKYNADIKGYYVKPPFSRHLNLMTQKSLPIAYVRT